MAVFWQLLSLLLLVCCVATLPGGLNRKQIHLQTHNSSSPVRRSCGTLLVHASQFTLQFAICNFSFLLSIQDTVVWFRILKNTHCRFCSSPAKRVPNVRNPFLVYLSLSVRSGVPFLQESFPRKNDRMTDECKLQLATIWHSKRERNGEC